MENIIVLRVIKKLIFIKRMRTKTSAMKEKKINSYIKLY
jgi:hypothetical protein